MSIKAFEGEDLSETDATIHLLHAFSRTKIAQSMPSFLHAEHAVSGNSSGTEEESDVEVGESGSGGRHDQGAGTLHAEEGELDAEEGEAEEGALDAEETEELLRALFAQYSNEDEHSQMSAGKRFRFTTAYYYISSVRILVYTHTHTHTHTMYIYIYIYININIYIYIYIASAYILMYTHTHIHTHTHTHTHTYIY